TPILTITITIILILTQTRSRAGEDSGDQELTGSMSHNVIGRAFRNGMSMREASRAVAIRRAVSSSGASMPRGKRLLPSVVVSVSTRIAGEPGQGLTSRKVSPEFWPPLSGRILIVTAAI